MPSIPERFARIAKHKFAEVRDRIEQVDQELADREAARVQTRANAQSELNDALSNERAFAAQNPAPPTASSTTPKTQPRSPQDIARGGAYSPQTSSSAPQQSATDPLLYHYRLLGVEPGSDFITVQGAYNALAARSDPARFAAGSDEQKEVDAIRKRLDESFKILHDALDPTVRRFDMLEI